MKKNIIFLSFIVLLFTFIFAACKDDNKENKTFTVSFYDVNELISTQIISYGEDAIEPEIPVKSGYIFEKWDKDFTNVKEDLIIKAIYVSKNKIYNITYDLDNTDWTYNSKNDMVLAFLKDFYEFIKPLDVDMTQFIYGEDQSYIGDWITYVGGSVGSINRFLKNNSIEEIDDSYFLNSSKYRDKWAPLFEYGKNVICAKNQRFGGKDYQYGILDFYRYIIGDPMGYLDYYGGEEGFYGFPDFTVEILEKYSYSETEIELPKPLNSKFAGWVDQNGNVITKIAPKTVGDLTLKASWLPNNIYTISFDTKGGDEIGSIDIEYNSAISLPLPTKSGYKFVGWYLNDTKFTAEEYKFEFDINLVAKWVDPNASELEDLVYNGKSITYRNSNTVVQIPVEYRQKDEQLRAAWVSSFAGDFSPSTDKNTMMTRLTEILDILEAFNMNCIIFHIRTHNQAFYKTKLTYIAPEYGTYETFEEWDYLEWFIDECHKRGIEFHAWLNPYRVKSGSVDYRTQFANFPNNPASDESNLLYGDSGYILMDPAVPAVRDFVVNICMDIMDNYDIDAIHFDDYFYAAGIDDSASIAKYNTKKLSTDNFRREQVDLFIKQLKDAMDAKNIQNNTKVQLGISPTGIYRNGNGSVESGSNTSGYAHYGNPLYADTYKWIKNEWIDYILPQSYWAFGHSTAGYADVMDWWNKAVEGTKVNLYSGIGLYMNNNNGSNASWGTQPYEVSNQVLYTTKLENCKGVSFYAFKSLRDAYKNKSSMAYAGVMRIKDEYWTEKVSTPSTIASTSYNERNK